jgi:aminoglycoside 2'-N-acetyltransferase I
VVELRTAHTAELGNRELRAIHVLLAESFGETFTDDDYEHALGGVHALAWVDPPPPP